MNTESSAGTPPKLKPQSNYRAENALVIASAAGRWTEILMTHGIAEQFLSGKHSFCPIHGGKDGFRFTDEGRGCWVCATCTGDKFMDGFNLIEKFKGVRNSEAFRMVAEYLRGNQLSSHTQKTLSKKKTLGQDLTQAQRQEQGAIHAKAILSQCIRRTHPYLQAKGLDQLALVNTKLYRVRGSEQIVRAGALIIPLYDLATKRLVSLQFINADGSRGYIAGSIIANAVHTVSGSLPRSFVGICEGYGNALTVSMVMGVDTIMACDSGGMVSKCQRIAAAHLDKSIVLFCDNDKNGVGQQAGLRASNLTGGITITPPDVGQDWNDYFKQHGLEQTRAAISYQLKSLRNDNDRCTEKQ